jgi:hypothetical protein
MKLIPSVPFTATSVQREAYLKIAELLSSNIVWAAMIAEREYIRLTNREYAAARRLLKASRLELEKIEKIEGGEGFQLSLNTSMGLPFEVRLGVSREED